MGTGGRIFESTQMYSSVDAQCMPTPLLTPPTEPETRYNRLARGTQWSSQTVYGSVKYWSTSATVDRHTVYEEVPNDIKTVSDRRAGIGTRSGQATRYRIITDYFSWYSQQ